MARRTAAPSPVTDGASGAPSATEEAISLDPTEAELEEWADQERRRRAAWLNGPTPEERAIFARQERERRLADLGGTSRDRFRRGLHYPREAQLAAEGAMSILLRWSRRTMAELVEAGREWEDELSGPRRRSRVPLDDDQP
jgi:hypothetical protein